MPDGQVVDSGLEYRTGAPVLVYLRQRGDRVDLDDHGGAVALVGRPEGWLDAAEQVVAADGLNVNRRGVVFVPVTTRRDLEDLSSRLARCSRDLYLALLDLR